VDVDYTTELSEGSLARFQEILSGLAAEMHLDVEEVPLGVSSPCRRTRVRGDDWSGVMAGSMSISLTRTASR
jgi:hypothetical protein